MKNFIIIIAISFFLLSIVSCDNEDTVPSDPDVTFKADLHCTGEIPALTSSATGDATLVFNPNTKTFRLTVNYIGLSATTCRIQNSVAGFSELIVFPLSNLTSPITFTSVALNSAQEMDLIANHYNIILHSAAYPDGEIQGLLIKQGTGNGGGPPPPPGY